jgi:predicted nucleotidyltransferase
LIFRDVAAEVGLNFHHFNGSTGEFYLPEIMGAGGALLDYDGDGDLDVFLVQGSMLDKTKKASEAQFPLPKGQPPGNRLFRNELVPTGKLIFTDVTRRSGLHRELIGMGAAAGDYDNDGDFDLYVTSFGNNLLYRNNGNGTFTDVTQMAAVDDPRWSSSAAFLDYDRDGDLDLFLTNYLDFTIRSNKRCFSPGGEPDYCTPAAYRSVPDRIFRNEGNGRFVDATLESGIGLAYGPGLGVTACDFNGDGWIDLFVANDGAANQLWINQGNGRFAEQALMAGVAYAMDGVARAGMGAAAGDIDNDGDADVLVTNLAREGSTLFLNKGGLFSDASLELGLSLPTFRFTGFGAGWLDYNNDGFLDLFAANGAVTILESLRGTPYPFQQRNQLFHNAGGNKLQDVSGTAGPALELEEVSRGAAFGDIDNDGDIDILVTNNNGPVRLLRNEIAKTHHWLEVRLEGTKDNRTGIGSRVGVRRKSRESLWRLGKSDGSYLTASDSRVHFGLGTQLDIEAVIVEWPSGLKEQWLDIRADRIVTLRQGSGRTVTVK